MHRRLKIAALSLVAFMLASCPAAPSFAGPPVIWSASCSSGIFNLATNSCLAVGTGVTSVTGTAPVVSSGGATPAISMAQATSSIDGWLSHSDWSLFNTKQAAISNQTAPSHQFFTSFSGGTFGAAQPSFGDISGSLNLATQVTGLLDLSHITALFANKSVSVAFVSGNDSTGDGSIQRPWKTVQHACSSISPSVNVPITIRLSEGNNDSDASGITCPGNVAFVSDIPIQINQALTISGSTNDTVAFYNILLESTFTWSRNDAFSETLYFYNSAIVGLLDVEQAGAGKAVSGAFFYDSGITGGATFQVGQVDLIGNGTVSGTVNYKDSGAAFLIATGNDLFNATLQLNGGITAELAGNIADAGYSIACTTTGSGTPTLMSDPGSVPPKASRSGCTEVANAQGEFINYTQGVAIGESGAPTASNVLLSIKDGHIKSTQTTAPTTTVQAAAGTSATCTVAHATDVAGQVTIAFGSASFATGDQCDINFNKAHGVAPICNITPANAAAASDMGSNHQVYVSSSTSALSINYGLAQNSAGQSNVWNYRCMETQ